MIASAAKAMVGAVVACLVPQCRYKTSVFLIGHMRCGSTALSAIICSRPEISGYGEAHIAYGNRAALGVLALNQVRRRAWRGSASGLFDKILHSRYDCAASAAFFSSRAVFMAREPRAAIHSIRHLFAKIDSPEYATDAMAADYYEERVQQMLRLWPRFADDRRVAITYEALTADPGRLLDTISVRLGFDPPLTNQYEINAAAAARGAGDPLSAPRHTRIVAASVGDVARLPLDITQERIAVLELLYRQFCALA